jgi:hypothetical protein
VLRETLTALLVAVSLVHPALAFKFDEGDAKARQEEQARAQRIYEQLSVECKQGLKNKKIMVVVGETHANGVTAIQSKYGPIFDVINQRLQGLGLRTYTQEQIRKQVAQAEIDAYFRNDPDAAIAASRKLAANFILRGLIEARSSVNRMLGIDEVSVSMGFTLTSASGRTVSRTNARSEAYSGSDTLATALSLVEEQADEVVAKLYYDYCTSADVSTKKR